MSSKYLGETFDIHGGGQDLIFPHHENDTTTLRLVPQRKGLPSIEKGYVYAAQKTAFTLKQKKPTRLSQSKPATAL